MNIYAMLMPLVISSGVFQETSSEVNKGVNFVTVGSTQDCNFSSIQDAINSGADDIRISDEGVPYLENIIVSDKNLTLRGDFANCSNAANNIPTIGLRSTIDGDQFSAAINIEGDEVLNQIAIQGFRLINGSGSYGAGIVVNKTHVDLKLIDSVIESNNSTFGAGISVRGADSLHLAKMIIQDSKIKSNAATQDGGGLFCQNAELIIYGTSEFENNLAYNGGGIAADHTCQVDIFSPTKIINNNATELGGGISANTAMININGVEQCYQIDQCYGENKKTVEISDNHALYGGAIYEDDSAVRMSNVNITRNSASNGGAFVVVNSLLDVGVENQNSCWDNWACTQLSENSASTAGGLYWSYGADSDIKIHNAHIYKNNAPKSAVGSQLQGGEAFFEGSFIYSNGSSGSIDLFSSLASSPNLIITYSTLVNNQFQEALFNMGGTGVVGVFTSIINEFGTIFQSGGAIDNFQCVLVNESESFSSGPSVLVADPMFVNKGSNNFHLSPDSPAIDYCDTGVFENEYNDIDGQQRGIDVSNPNEYGAYDLGADEYTGNDDLIFEDDFEFFE